MHKSKCLQLLLMLTALVMTACFVDNRFCLAKPQLIFVFIILVLLPQIIAIFLQFREVRERYIAMVTESIQELFGHRSKRPLCAEFISVFTYTFAVQKSRGINPNRAGPVFCM